MRFEHSSGYVEDEARRIYPRILRDGTSAAQAAAAAHQIMWPKPGEMRDYYLAQESPSPSTIVPGPTTIGQASGKLSIYDDRVRNSVMPPVWWSAVSNAALAPIREPITLDGWSPKIDEWTSNIDGSGRNLKQFMLQVLSLQAVDGIAFGLTDLDPAGDSASRSLGEDDRAGRRPYAVVLSSCDVDPIAVGRIAGETVLVKCGVYQESTSRPGGATSKESKSAVWRIFELRPGDGGQVWSQDLQLKEPDRESEIAGETAWRQVRAMGAGVLSRLPITPFYGDFWSGPYRAKPPYLSPAELAIAAFRKRSEKDAYGREVSRFRVFQNHVPVDKQGNPKTKMLANFLYSPREGTAATLETNGAALRELREDLRDDEQAVRSAARSIAAESTSGDITATEIGLRGMESGTYQEVVTQGNAQSIAWMLRDFESLGGVKEAKGATVSWPYKSVRSLSDETLERLYGLAKELDEKGDPLLPLSTLLWLERAAGNVPEKLDITKAIDGRLEE